MGSIKENYIENSHCSDITKKIKCQQCLNELEHRNNHLICNFCNKCYPIHNNLIFMGYNEIDENEVDMIIFTEREHQTNLNEMEKHYKFAKNSFKLANSIIKILKTDINILNPTAVDIGCGGSPNGQILSENGFNTYRCELDPNSLYSGLIYKHSHLGLGKHIVCDSRWLPFANNSLDLVFCKELAHHIQDYSSFFSEINRVLKIGGIFCLIEPTITIKDNIACYLSPNHDTHYGHHFQTNYRYFEGLKKSFFDPYRYYYINTDFCKIINPKIQPQIKSSPNSIKLKKIIQYIIGGQNIIFSKKIEDISNDIKRPKINCIKPSRLILDQSFLRDPRWTKLGDILTEVQD